MMKAPRTERLNDEPVASARFAIEERELRAALAAAAALAEAIHDLREVPAGHLYAHLSGHLSLDAFTQAIRLLERTGLVTESPDHLIRWIGPRQNTQTTERTVSHG